MPLEKERKSLWLWNPKISERNFETLGISSTDLDEFIKIDANLPLQDDNETALVENVKQTSDVSNGAEEINSQPNVASWQQSIAMVKNLQKLAKNAAKWGLSHL